MVVAALALHHQLFSLSNSKTGPRPWLSYKTNILHSQKKNRFYFISCSSSFSSTSESPEANIETAESCVNLGLQLFSKGRVILAGKKETVSLAIQKAERFRTELIRRGVLVVPVIWGQGMAPQIEKKGFGVPSKAAAAIPSIGEDFEKRAQSITAKSKLKAEIRFKAEILSPAEWERWIRDQQKFEGVNPGEDVYIILHLDGRV